METIDSLLDYISWSLYLPPTKSPYPQDFDPPTKTEFMIVEDADIANPPDWVENIDRKEVTNGE